MKSRIINVDYLARVEGEGALYVKIDDDKVRNVELRIFEPPRFFEAFLRGRDFREVPDITARICGICPIAYMNGSIHAMEMACGIESLDGPIRELRRLVYLYAASAGFSWLPRCNLNGERPQGRGGKSAAP